MKPPVIALLVLCALCPVTSFLASKSYQADHASEPHAYTVADTAALAAMIDKPDDLLARGRHAALTRPQGLVHPKTQAEAGRIIARMGL